MLDDKKGKKMNKMKQLLTYQKLFLGDIFIRKHFKLFFWRLSKLLQLGTLKNGVWDILVWKTCQIFDRKLQLPEPKLLNLDEIRNVAKNMEKDGYSIFPKKLSEEDINELKKVVFSIPAYDENNNKVYISENNIANLSKSARYFWKMEDLIHIDIVQKIIQDSTYAHIAQEYFNCKPLLTYIRLWLDPVYDGEVISHIFHRDGDSPKYFKIFFYLTDVDINSGAHVFIKNTHYHKLKDPFYKMTRYSEEELLEYFGKDKKVVFEAPAGTIIAEDTHGFHRGSTPKKSYRLLFGFQFSIIDSYNYNYDREGLKITKAEIKGLDKNLQKIYKKVVK